MAPEIKNHQQQKTVKISYWCTTSEPAVNIFCAGGIFFRFLITPGTKRTRSLQLCHLHTCCRGHLNQNQIYNHIMAQNVKTMIRKCSLLTKKDMHRKDQQQSVFINSANMQL